MNQKIKREWAKRKLTKAEKAALKRLEREQEIYAKAPEELTESEWKWLGDVMDKIHRENPQGRKKQTRYDDWMHQIARARLQGRKPLSLRELAGVNLPEKGEALRGEYLEEIGRARDKFKKARKRREIPAPPRR